MTLRLASVAWKIRANATGDHAYFGHFHDLVSAAHDQGADAVVFPELHVMELLPLARQVKAEDAAKYLAQYANGIEEWVARISNSSGLIIIGGSHFRNSPNGIKNVCAIGVPGVGVHLAEKNNLTTYERDVWNLLPGKGLAMAPQNLGVTICYDVEFPESGRALAEAGTLVQCVPSWTETERGFQRVRWSCLARAVEHQIYVAHASLVGDLGREPVPETFGSAAIIAPSVEPFPVQSMVVETPLNEEGVAIADLDYDLLTHAREKGEVRNWADRRSGSWIVAGQETKPRFPNANGEWN